MIALFITQFAFVEAHLKQSFIIAPFSGLLLCYDIGRTWKRTGLNFEEGLASTEKKSVKKTKSDLVLNAIPNPKRKRESN